MYIACLHSLTLKQLYTELANITSSNLNAEKIKFKTKSAYY